MKAIILLAWSLLFSIAVQATGVGSQAPSFTLDTIKNFSDKQIKLSAYKGKVVYVDFWASWCGPCQRSFPKLDALRAKYKDKGFEVIAINLDEKAKDAHEFLAKYPVTFPIAYDPKGKVAEQYKLKGMPTAFIIDRKGMVSHIVVGFNETDEVKTIEAVLNQLTRS